MNWPTLDHPQEIQMPKKVVVPSSKPRNHIVMAAIGRGGAGSHGKTRKAERRADKVKMHRGDY
jgi:hypothetical protein